MIHKDALEILYVQEKLSVAQIAAKYSCSQQKVNYWLAKHDIKKRSIADALYERKNPNGDPFSIKHFESNFDYFLFGLGCGLYWGEGNKKNRTCVRLGNTDPMLVKIFILYLNERYAIDEQKLHYGLQIFSDMDPNKAKAFWVSYLNANPKNFQKTIVTPSRAQGTYGKKCEHGVLTVYFNNRKLRDTICGHIEKMECVFNMKVPE
jgi:hypothetical protein